MRALHLSGLSCPSRLVYQSCLLLLLVSCPMFGADASQGYALLTQAVAHENQLPSLVNEVDNAIGAGDSNVSSAKVYRQVSTTGRVSTRVELAPTTERGKMDPARFTKVFIATQDHTYLLYRGKAICVDPALVPTYGINDFLVPADPAQQYAVIPSQVHDRPCSRVTQIISDPHKGDITMRYDIDNALGIIIAVTRQDGDTLTYSMSRADLHVSADSTPAELFAAPVNLSPGLVSEMDRLLEIFKNGIP